MGLRKRAVTAALAAACFTALWTALPAGASAPGTQTVDRAGTLQSSNQSMWGAGAAQPPGDESFTLFDQTWNASGSGGAVQHVTWPLGFDPTPAARLCDPFSDWGDPFSDGFGVDDDDDCSWVDATTDDDNIVFDIGDFGASGSAGTKGEVGMSVKLNGFNRGTVGVTYPVTAHFTQPADDTFAPGDQVTIDTSKTIGSGASITSQFPTLAGLGLDGVFGFQANASFKLCVFSCTADTSLFNLSIPDGYDGTNPARGSLFSVDLPTSTQCFNFLVNFPLGFGPAPAEYTRCQNSAGTNQGYLAPPNVTTSTKLNADGTLTATGVDPYAVVPVSAVTWAQRIIPGAGTLIPLNFAPTEIPDSGGIKVGWTTANLIFTAVEKMQQDFGFAPRVDITLSWGQTLNYEVRKPDSTLFSQGSGTSATFPLGYKLLLTTPSSLSAALHVTPTLSLGQATFSNHTQNLNVGQGEFKALSLTLKTPSATFDIGYGVGNVTVWPGTDIDVGPVYDKEFPLASSSNNILNSSWTLGGFNQPTLNDVVLTPDLPPAPTAKTVAPVEGASFSGTVASFIDPDSSDAAADYTASIDWGDGTTTTGSTVDDSGGNGHFHVTGTHTYAEEGTYNVRVTVQDVDTTNLHASVTSTANVSDAALHATGGLSLSAVEGKPFSNVKVGSFTDDDPSGTLSDFSGTIDWGDGQTSTATIKANANGGWDVYGGHTYEEESTPTVTFTVNDGGGASDSTTSSMAVADAAIHATPRQNSATTGSPSVPLLLWPAPPASGIVATFTDEDPHGAVADYRATVDWGDGTSSGGTIVTNPAGSGFAVRASHTYATLGFYTITIDVYDSGGSHDRTSTRLLTYAFSGTGGNFVISSKAAGSSTVTFWSGDWASQNGLVGPTGFKGFANTPSDSSSVDCGSHNAFSTTNGGNSVSAPSSVPAFLTVLVANGVAQAGSTFSGAASRIVVVRTNPGYGLGPGHPGTGTIVAQICG